MTALTLSSVVNLQSTTTAETTINNNSSATVTAVENCLAKDGSDDTMTGNLNMNSNRITNLPTPLTSGEPVTLGYLTSLGLV